MKRGRICAGELGPGRGVGGARHGSGGYDSAGGALVVDGSDVFEIGTHSDDDYDVRWLVILGFFTISCSNKTPFIINH